MKTSSFDFRAPIRMAEIASSQPVARFPKATPPLRLVDDAVANLGATPLARSTPDAPAFVSSISTSALPTPYSAPAQAGNSASRAAAPASTPTGGGGVLDVSSSPPPAAPPAFDQANIRPLTMQPMATAASATNVKRIHTIDMEGAGGPSVSGGGQTLLQMYGPPTLNGSGDMIVGGSTGGRLVAPSNMEILKSVTWNFTGAEKQQNYSIPLGETLPYSPVTDTWNGGSVMNDQTGAFWNATPGNHTITAGFVYSDGSSGSVSTVVSISQPTVNSFTVTQTGTVHGNDALGQDSLNALLTYQASASTPANSGGSFGLIQMVNRNDSITDTVTQNPDTFLTHRLISGGLVLDNFPGKLGDEGIFFMPGDTRTAVAANTTNNALFLQPDGSNAADQPSTPFMANKTDVGATTIVFHADFKIYLVFKTTNGIWVEVAETPLITTSGTAQFLNGVYNVAPASPATVTTGNPTNGFVSWNNYYSGNPAIQWNPPWNSP